MWGKMWHTLAKSAAAEAVRLAVFLALSVAAQVGLDPACAASLASAVQRLAELGNRLFAS
jgi:hypothetical protein